MNRSGPASLYVHAALGDGPRGREYPSVRVSSKLTARMSVRIAFAAAALGFAAPALAIDGKQLLRKCEALERGAIISGDSVRLPNSADAAECWFYMGAVQDFSATVEKEGGPSIIGSCLRPNTTRIEIVRAFTKYARANRADLDLRATALIIPALIKSFPCPKAG